MPSEDRTNDIRQPGAPLGSSNHNDLRHGMSPSLTEQTPGLDRTSRVRNLAMRPVSYARERPAVAVSIIGGLIVLGIGTWLALRQRRPTRWQMMRDYGVAVKDRGVDAYDWLRSKI